MSDYCWINPSHILLFPREDILILFQEMGKTASEVFRNLGSDVGEVFRVIVQLYRLQLFRGLRSGVYLVAHVELVQVYVVDYFLLHGCRVALLGYALVCSNHSYSTYGRKLDHHMVSGGDGLYGVERGSAQ